MPLQNRVDPHSQLQAVSARGTLMGNRGRLHNAEQQIVSQWKGRPWITCALYYKERKRELMAPNSYTELFFLDEPTAYAAGHRPCAECRRPAYKLFKEVWAKAFPEQLDLSAPAIDTLLQAARLQEDGSQRTWSAPLADLPDGSIIEHGGECMLLWGGKPWIWSFAGYKPLLQTIHSLKVTVLTPEPVVQLLRNGLAETLEVHPSIKACHKDPNL